MAKKRNNNDKMEIDGTQRRSKDSPVKYSSNFTRNNVLQKSKRLAEVAQRNNKEAEKKRDEAQRLKDETLKEKEAMVEMMKNTFIAPKKKVQSFKHSLFLRYWFQVLLPVL